jgi:hypothetical protein
VLFAIVRFRSVNYIRASEFMLLGLQIEYNNEAVWPQMGFLMRERWGAHWNDPWCDVLAHGLHQHIAREIEEVTGERERRKNRQTKEPHHREHLNGNDVLTRFLWEFALCWFHRRQNDPVSKISITSDSERSVMNQTCTHTSSHTTCAEGSNAERASYSRSGSHARMDLKLQMTDYVSMSRDSAVGIATGYGLDDWEVGVRV